MKAYVIFAKANIDTSTIPSPGTLDDKVVVYLDRAKAEAAAKENDAEVIGGTVEHFRECAAKRICHVGPYAGIMVVE